MMPTVLAEVTLPLASTVKTGIAVLDPYVLAVREQHQWPRS